MLNIVIPMAGEGIRFRQRGYELPKPLIEIKGSPMIARVVGNIRPRGAHRFVFLCREQHCRDYPVRALLSRLAPDSEIVVLNRPTEGAACTVLLAEALIDNDDELLLANSDQYVEADVDAFLADSRTKGFDGSIMTFFASEPKWSFVRRGPDGLVTEVAEKKPISTEATVGLYHFRRGRDFVRGAKAMIAKGVRVNGEFYVCPVYNEVIQDGRKIGAWEIPSSQMHGLGTPEDLDVFRGSQAFSRL